jgi:sugar lactone lactonase YvrE
MSILISLVRHTFELVLVTTVLILIVALLPQSLFPGFPLQPVSYEVPDLTRHLIGWNNVLGEKSERLLNNLVVGPESIAQWDDKLYVGTADGRLLEVRDVDTETPSLRFVTRFAETGADDCYDNEYHKLDRCGRPLGLRFDSRGNLIVADGIFGLFRVNVTTGDKSLILGSDSLAADMRGIYNDIVFDPANENIVYLTISSTKWGLGQVPWSLAEHENSGQVVAIDVNSKSVTRLLDGIFFANGIELSADNQFLLVSECTKYDILKISLDQIRKVISGAESASSLKKEVFARNLPGEPDNIRLFNGNIYVAFAITRAKGRTVSDMVSRLPILRKAFGRLCFIISRIVNFVDNVFGHNPALEEVSFLFSSGHVVYDSIPPASAIAVLDGRTGAFKGILGSEKFAFISEAHVDQRTGDIYFGSFRNRFLGRIRAKDVLFG